MTTKCSTSMTNKTTTKEPNQYSHRLSLPPGRHSLPPPSHPCQPQTPLEPSLEKAGAFRPPRPALPLPPHQPQRRRKMRTHRCAGHSLGVPPMAGQGHRSLRARRPNHLCPPPLYHLLPPLPFHSVPGCVAHDVHRGESSTASAPRLRTPPRCPGPWAPTRRCRGLLPLPLPEPLLMLLLLPPPPPYADLVSGSRVRAAKPCRGRLQRGDRTVDSPSSAATSRWATAAWVVHLHLRRRALALRRRRRCYTSPSLGLLRQWQKHCHPPAAASWAPGAR